MLGSEENKDVITPSEAEKLLQWTPEKPVEKEDWAKEYLDRMQKEVVKKREQLNEWFEKENEKFSFWAKRMGSAGYSQAVDHFGKEKQELDALEKEIREAYQTKSRMFEAEKTTKEIIMQGIFGYSILSDKSKKEFSSSLQNLEYKRIQLIEGIVDSNVKRNLKKIEEEKKKTVTEVNDAVKKIQDECCELLVERGTLLEGLKNINDNPNVQIDEDKRIEEITKKITGLDNKLERFWKMIPPDTWISERGNLNEFKKFKDFYKIKQELKNNLRKTFYDLIIRKSSLENDLKEFSNNAKIKEELQVLESNLKNINRKIKITIQYSQSIEFEKLNMEELEQKILYANMRPKKKRKEDMELPIRWDTWEEMATNILVQEPGYDNLSETEKENFLRRRIILEARKDEYQDKQSLLGKVASVFIGTEESRTIQTDEEEFKRNLKEACLRKPRMAKAEKIAEENFRKIRGSQKLSAVEREDFLSKLEKVEYKLVKLSDEGSDLSIEKKEEEKVVEEIEKAISNEYYEEYKDQIENKLLTEYPDFNEINEQIRLKLSDKFKNLEIKILVLQDELQLSSKNMAIQKEFEGIELESSRISSEIKEALNGISRNKGKVLDEKAATQELNRISSVAEKKLRQENNAKKILNEVPGNARISEQAREQFLLELIILEKTKDAYNDNPSNKDKIYFEKIDEKTKAEMAKKVPESAGVKIFNTLVKIMGGVKDVVVDYIVPKDRVVKTDIDKIIEDYNELQKKIMKAITVTLEAEASKEEEYIERDEKYKEFNNISSELKELLKKDLLNVFTNKIRAQENIPLLYPEESIEIIDVKMKLANELEKDPVFKKVSLEGKAQWVSRIATAMTKFIEIKTERESIEQRLKGVKAEQDTTLSIHDMATLKSRRDRLEIEEKEQKNLVDAFVSNMLLDFRNQDNKFAIGESKNQIIDIYNNFKQKFENFAKDPKVQSALAGMLTIGALGSALPFYGTASGALIGAVLGYRYPKMRYLLAPFIFLAREIIDIASKKKSYFDRIFRGGAIGGSTLAAIITISTVAAGVGLSNPFTGGIIVALASVVAVALVAVAAAKLAKVISAKVSEKIYGISDPDRYELTNAAKKLFGVDVKRLAQLERNTKKIQEKLKKNERKPTPKEQEILTNTEMERAKLDKLEKIRAYFIRNIRNIQNKLENIEDKNGDKAQNHAALLYELESTWAQIQNGKESFLTSWQQLSRHLYLKRREKYTTEITKQGHVNAMTQHLLKSVTSPSVVSNLQQKETLKNDLNSALEGISEDISTEKAKDLTFAYSKDKKPAKILHKITEMEEVDKLITDLKTPKPPKPEKS